MDSIWEEFARLIFHVDVGVAARPGRGDVRPEERAPPPTSRSPAAAERSSPRRSPRRAPRPRGAAAAAAATARRQLRRQRQRRRQRRHQPGTVVKAESEKIGRNDPCWCGRGKKYKKCHGA